jgi:hypothetical protein
MEKDVLALVEIDRQQVEPHAVAAVHRLLDAQRGSQTRAVVTDQDGEKIAVRDGGAASRRREDQDGAGSKGCDALRRNDLSRVG